jgi:hypothetical protein
MEIGYSYCALKSLWLRGGGYMVLQLGLGRSVNSLYTTGKNWLSHYSHHYI